MTPSPLLTIAMPVFNGGEALRLAVQSMINQSFKDWELLLIDDGSTDGAVERLPAPLDPRIRVVRDGVNKGLAARLNEAIAAARGRYFARMDHDDIAHPERFALQLAFMENNPAVDLLGAYCVTIDTQDKVVGVLPGATTHPEICRRMWRGFYLAHPTWLGRTEWFRAHPYQEPAPYCCEDQELLLRGSPDSRYAALPTPLLAYRVRQRLAWRKLLRTRLALFRVQTAYFLARRRPDQASLSLLSMLVRVGTDATRKLAEIGGLSAAPVSWGVLPPEVESYWTALIAELRRQAGASRRR